MTRVLIVDDHHQNRYLLRALFLGHGFAVTEAAHGADALALARQSRPDLVVTDLLMPVMDGYTLLRQWRADPELRQIPFVVYTATYTEPRDERLALALGADAFIIKPAEPEVLLARVKEVLAAARLGALPAHAPDQEGDDDLLVEYNAVLVRKLEQKAHQLELANRELREEIAERKRADATLRESEAQYRMLFHSITNPLFVYDRESLAYLAVNDAAVAHYGYSREEFLTMTIKDIRPAEDVPSLLELLAAAGTNMERRGVWRHRKKDGSIIEVDISAYGLDYAGRPACLVEARDVTEQRRAEAEAARTTELLRMVSDGAPDAVFVKDRDGKYLLFNKAASRLVGKPVDEVLGRDDTALFGPEDAREIMTSDRMVMESDQVQTVEESLDTAVGPRTFQAIKVPNHDGAGNVIGLIGISRDITDRRRTEETLRLRDRAIQAASQGILISDCCQPDNPIIFANAGFEQITGYRSDEVIGRNCRFLQGRDTDPETTALLREAIADGRACAVEILNYRKDGAPFWNALSLNPVHDDAGALTHYVGIQQDVTERKKLEEQLRQSQKMEAVGRLAGGIAHDFNNLLTVISGYSELLLATPELRASIREPVKNINEAGKRAAALTRQLLGFSRQTILQPKVLDVNHVISEMATMLRRLIGEDIQFNTVLHPGVHRVRVDPSQLDQVLINLAVNARDAMPRGGRLTLETANVELSDEYAQTHLDCGTGPHVMLAMTDTGCGMTPEVASRIFEPFYTTKEVGKGTGLGLAMVFGIVQQSEGCIHVYSEPGLGTTFKLYFPAVAEDAAGAGGTASGQATRGTETILLVEDDEGVRGLALVCLRMHGYRVLTASDGKEALELVRAHQGPLDLILTDVVMPNLSGPELAAGIRGQFPDLKVLFMSGYTDDAVVRHGLLEAEVSFIQKPYTPQALAEKVRHVLDGK